MLPDGASGVVWIFFLSLIIPPGRWRDIDLHVNTVSKDRKIQNNQLTKSTVTSLHYSCMMIAIAIFS